jgi:uncharacterized protein YutE (UPF0331/DUF86 family)
MRSITGQLTSELSSFISTVQASKADAFLVRNFRELVEHAARLAYLNKDHLLFFRGQHRDFRNKAGASTFYPSIYRGERVSRAELELRFDILFSAARRLCDALESARIEGFNDVKRRRYIQWSVLQHYGVCSTPLLDLTHSIRVASSFAFLGSSDGDPYVFVFGLPYITNRISVNSEHDIVNVRLLSICPPDALRPYFQEGYLAGTDEITTEYTSKDELDFNNRLIAKFRLRRDDDFWGEGFGPIPESDLYPPDDRFEEICSQVKEELGTEIEPGRLGSFLQAWADLENMILTIARRRREKVFSLREALTVLSRYELLPSGMGERLDKLRQLRNIAVHEPSRLKPGDLSFGLQEISELRSEVQTLISSKAA